MDRRPNRQAASKGNWIVGALVSALGTATFVIEEGACMRAIIFADEILSGGLDASLH
jgi:hypothetical protein